MPSNSMPQPSDEAEECFNQARKLDEELHGQESDAAVLREQAALYALAVQKANGFFPDAHANLGLALMKLGDIKRARQELIAAIQQDECHAFARGLLIVMDSGDLGVKATVRTGEWLDLLFVAGEAVAAQGRLASFSRQIDDLASAFEQDITRSNNVDYWIWLSDYMLTVHDAIQGVKKLLKKARLAEAVLNAP